jgi:hypothetical protein
MQMGLNGPVCVYRKTDTPQKPKYFSIYIIGVSTTQKSPGTKRDTHFEPKITHSHGLGFEPSILSSRLNESWQQALLSLFIVHCVSLFLLESRPLHQIFRPLIANLTSYCSWMDTKILLRQRSRILHSEPRTMGLPKFDVVCRSCMLTPPCSGTSSVACLTEKGTLFVCVQ